MSYSEFGTGGEITSQGTTVIHQVVDNQGGYARGPERSLLAALLFDGVQNYLNYCSAQSGSVRNRFQEAYNWVMSNETDYVFSFIGSCEALGIDYKYLRLGLINISNSYSDTIKKSRRNF